MPSLLSLPLHLLLGVFAAAAVIVWWAGKRLPAIAVLIGERTGIGQAFAGMLLLGGITTLPELATTSSASVLGDADLALNNLLGSAAFNLLLLAAADFVLGPKALTSSVAKPATLLQGVLGMLVLAATAATIITGEQAIGPVGLGSTLLFLLCLGSIWIASRFEARPTWRVASPLPEVQQAPATGDSDQQSPYLRLAGLAVLILAGGVALSQSAEAIAVQTGLGAGLVGFILLAVATSLPELTTITAAVRSGHCTLAVGDIFGANLFNVGMIFLIDLLSPSAPVLQGAGGFEAIAALLALMLTGCFVVGLLERRDKALLRMGYDSIAAVLLYAAGLVLLCSWQI